jgi:hypothetical protein
MKLRPIHLVAWASCLCLTACQNPDEAYKEAELADTVEAWTGWLDRHGEKRPELQNAAEERVASLMVKECNAGSEGTLDDDCAAKVYQRYPETQAAWDIAERLGRPAFTACLEDEELRPCLVGLTERFPGSDLATEVQQAVDLLGGTKEARLAALDELEPTALPAQALRRQQCKGRKILVFDDAQKRIVEYTTWGVFESLVFFFQMDRQAAADELPRVSEPLVAELEAAGCEVEHLREPSVYLDGMVGYEYLRGQEGRPRYQPVHDAAALEAVGADVFVWTKRQSLVPFVREGTKQIEETLVTIVGEKGQLAEWSAASMERWSEEPAESWQLAWSGDMDQIEAEASVGLETSMKHREAHQAKVLADIDKVLAGF